MDAINLLSSIMLIVFLGCDSSFNREMEIFPGIKWKYYSMRHSSIAFENYGVITEGNLFVSFYQYGISISGGKENFYYDARTNRLVDNEDIIGSFEGYAVMDASTAFGIFSKESYNDFNMNVRLLCDRVKNFRAERCCGGAQR